MADKIDCREEVAITETKMESKEKQEYSSRFKFVISLLGNSMGLGDMWRLPYLVYRNGGGAFLIPYACCVLFCGIPIFFLEMAMSQFSGGGSWNFYNICPLVQGIGIAFIVVNWMGCTYISIIRAWVIEYLINSFRADILWDSCDNWWNTEKCFKPNAIGNESSIMSNYSFSINESDVSLLRPRNVSFIDSMTRKVSPTEEFWEHRVLQMSSGLEEFGYINWMFVLYLFITQVIIFIAMTKGVNSIGKLMYITVIAPFVLLLAVWIRAMTLKGSWSGMLYFIKPDFRHLQRLEVWIEAAFMSFFTLGPGWGCIQAMSCHANFKGNCLRDASLVVVFTLFYGFLNGLVAFSVLGVMSEETGTDVSEVLQTGGFSLGFVSYPRAVVYFPFPQLWAATIFVILLLPTLDVAIILSEPVMCVLEEILPAFVAKRRIPLLLLVSSSSFLVSIPLTSSAGVYIFQMMDWYVGTVAIMIICIVETIVFAWVYGGDRINRDVQMMLGRPLPALIRICIAFLIPIFLLFLLAVSLTSYKPPTLGDYRYPDYVGGIGWCISMISITSAVLYAFFRIFREKGTLKTRLKTLLHYNSKWRPADPTYLKIFEESEKEYQWSIRNLIWFNLTGITNKPTNKLHELEKFQS